MTNYLDSLIARVPDPDLREEIDKQIAALRDTKQFGLVYEKHLPETVRLNTQPIVPRMLVQLRDGGDHTLWTVESVADETATITCDDGGETIEEEVALSDLVAVREFGHPIYPGLEPGERIKKDVEKPFHLVINSENYHALETLLYAYEGLVDCIYIDPPYNGGARDWKYNNHYVDGNDAYRHSKWLAMMERRLRLAKRLMNPQRSVLICAIDHNEVHRLGLLLEQVFPPRPTERGTLPSGGTVQMVETLINPRGQQVVGAFARSEDYIFFVTLGSAAVAGESDPNYGEGELVPWRTFRRSDFESRRGTIKGGPEQFYPIYVNEQTQRIDAVGDPLPHDVDRKKAPSIPGCVAVFPIRDNGTEMNWGRRPEAFRHLVKKGYARVGRRTTKPQAYEISYLTKGKIQDIESGRAVIEGYEDNGAVIARYVTEKLKMPTSMWTRSSHNAEVHGTGMLKALLGEEKLFPYPKSLYAVEDCLRYFIGDTPDAVVVDFFAGSGTTGHAVMRLNRDGGRRRSILVTNNEVSAQEAAALRLAGLHPGDEKWERQGICELVMKPRLRAAIEGRTPSGDPVEGDYRFTDEFPIADGLLENIEFFELKYLDRDTVARGKAFNAIAPLLWMKAGASGERIEVDNGSWSLPVSAVYGVLFNARSWAPFAAAVRARPDLRHAFVVTDSLAVFQQVAAELPPELPVTMLYEDYLSNFEINTGGPR